MNELPDQNETVRRLERLAYLLALMLFRRCESKLAAETMLEETSNALSCATVQLVELQGKCSSKKVRRVLAKMLQEEDVEEASQVIRNERQDGRFSLRRLRKWVENRLDSPDVAGLATVPVALLSVFSFLFLWVFYFADIAGEAHRRWRGKSRRHMDEDDDDESPGPVVWCLPAVVAGSVVYSLLWSVMCIPRSVLMGTSSILSILLLATATTGILRTLVMPIASGHEDERDDGGGALSRFMQIVLVLFGSATISVSSAGVTWLFGMGGWPHLLGNLQLFIAILVGLALVLRKQNWLPNQLVIIFAYAAALVLPGFFIGRLNFLDWEPVVPSDPTFHTSREERPTGVPRIAAVDDREVREEQTVNESTAEAPSAEADSKPGRRSTSKRSPVELARILLSYETGSQQGGRQAPNDGVSEKLAHAETVVLLHEFIDLERRVGRLINWLEHRENADRAARP